MNLEFLPLETLEQWDISSRLNHVASISGNATAIRSVDASLTFRQLNERASQVAASLKKQLPSDRQYPVILFLENGMEIFPAIYGVLRAGHFYCAIPVDYPIEYLSRVLQEMGECVMLTEDRHLNRIRKAIPDSCRPIIYSSIEQNVTKIDWPAIKPDALAAIYYTSGSTGAPKGVMLAHRCLLYIVHNYGAQLGIRAGDRFLTVRPFGSYSSAIDTFGGLLNGSSLIRYDFKVGGVLGLISMLKSEKITVFRPPVQLVRTLLEAMPDGEFLPNIRMFFATGDVFYKKDVERLRPFLPRAAIIIHQFATSETGLLTANRIYSNTVLDEEVIPLGTPMPGQEIVLLDEEGRIVTDHSPGEIGVRGDYLFAGYWNQPELSIAKFMPDPRDPQKKIFRTGDLGRFRLDGQLAFIGRNDSRVRIKGYSVDLSAVDHEIQTIPGVARSVTIAQTNQSGVKRLVAYIQPIGKTVLSPADLRKNLLKLLPEYMVPYLFMIMEEFPLTYAGKVDRKALPLPDWKRPQSSAKYLPPRTPDEETMTTLWQKVFGLEQIGIHDDFFELGGDSLLASSLFVEIERTFQKRFPLSVLLKSRTVEALTATVRGQNATDLDRLVVLRSEGKNPPLFLIPGGGSDTITLIELAERLRSDQPVYGLEDSFIGLPNSIYANGIQRAAREFIDAIRLVQPGGPYYLGGHSFGGLVAFEMAQQLRNMGEEVGLLAILDTPPPVRVIKKGRVADRLQLHLNRIVGPSPREVGDYFAARFKKRLSRLGKSRWFQRLYNIKWVENSLWYDSRRYVQVARSEYAPQAYEGDAIVYRAAHRPSFVTWDATADWKDFILGKLEFYDVPGNHMYIVKHPNVERLAELMTEHLARAMQQDGEW